MNKILVRQNCFETNSSSCHSLSISDNKNVLLQTIIPDEQGNIILTGGQWGWEQDYYNNALSKANYCMQDIFDYAYGTKEDRTDQSKWQMLQKVIKDQTGAIEVSYDFDQLSDGYIDHQSSGITEEAFKSEEELKQFIFNPQSYFETDNDNH